MQARLFEVDAIPTPFIRSRYDEVVVEKFPVLNALGKLPDHVEDRTFPYGRFYLRPGAPLFDPAESRTEMGTQWTADNRRLSDNMIWWRPANKPYRGEVLKAFVQAISTPDTAAYEQRRPLVHLLFHVTDVMQSTAFYLEDLAAVELFDQHTARLTGLYQNGELDGDPTVFTRSSDVPLRLSLKGLKAMLDVAQPITIWPEPPVVSGHTILRPTMTVDTSDLL